MIKFSTALLNAILVVASSLLLISETVQAQPITPPWRITPVQNPNPEGTRCWWECFQNHSTIMKECMKIDSDDPISGQAVCGWLYLRAKDMCKTKPAAERKVCEQEALADYNLCLVQPESWCNFINEEEYNQCKKACKKVRPQPQPPGPSGPSSRRALDLMTPQ